VLLIIKTSAFCWNNNCVNKHIYFLNHWVREGLIYLDRTQFRQHDFKVEVKDSLCKSRTLVNVLKTEVYLNYEYLGNDPKSINRSIKYTITYLVNTFIIH
jgi:hypothetical protein